MYQCAPSQVYLNSQHNQWALSHISSRWSNLYYGNWDHYTGGGTGDQPTPWTHNKYRSEKTKARTKIHYVGISANPEDLGLQLYTHDPKKYCTYDKMMIGKEVKAGNIKFLFTNRHFMNNEEKIKRQLEAGAIGVHGKMVIARHKWKGIRHEYSAMMQLSSKTAK